MKIHEIINENLSSDAAKLLIREIAAEIKLMKASGQTVRDILDVATPRIRTMISNGSYTNEELVKIFKAAYREATTATSFLGFRLGLHYNDVIANLAWGTTLYSAVPALYDPIRNCVRAIVKENERLTAKEITEAQYRGAVAQELTQLTAKLIANGIGAAVIKGFGNKLGSFFTGPFKFVDDIIGGMTNVARYQFFEKVANDPKWNKAIAFVVINDIIVDIVGGNMLHAFEYITSGEIIKDLKYVVTHGELPPSKEKSVEPMDLIPDAGTPIGPPPRFNDPGPRIGSVAAPTKERPWDRLPNLTPSK
jgi:hypothetical protein